MSEKGDKAKLEAVLDYIQDIETIANRYKSIKDALADLEGQYALLMCIQQVGELVNKIKSEKYTSKIPVKNIVGFRNIIVHNYDGVNLKMVEGIIKINIPELKDIIKGLR
jgi:uncharacterized protein with HEPN domain